MKFPKTLLSISGKFPHSYALGRRCLLHHVINGKRKRHTIRVSSLLDVCPCIPRPNPDEKWSPSILERRVIAPFTAAMNALAGREIIQWNYRAELSQEDYETFSAGIVEVTVVEQQSIRLSVQPEMKRRGSQLLHFNGTEFLNL